MKNYFYLTVLTLISVTIFSCSSDLSIETEKISNTEMFSKSTEPVPVFDIVTELVSINGGCYKLQVSLYANGVDAITHTPWRHCWNTAYVEVGDCDKTYAVEDEFNGFYNGDWVSNESRYHGSKHIRKIWDENPDTYREFVSQRDSLIK